MRARKRLSNVPIHQVRLRCGFSSFFSTPDPLPCGKCVRSIPVPRLYPRVVGHRALRVEDFGKVAATFVDTHTGRAVRIAPVLDIRERACAFIPEESRHYFAQMQAYQVMSDEDMMTVQEVSLCTFIERITSRPGLRVNCDVCGEEIMNEREVLCEGMKLCCTCSGNGYYRPVIRQAFHLLSLIQHE